tara:strand:- start:403 stop:852 length:450 start_codon:yes stop_codon:yes gene_type:complete
MNRNLVYFPAVRIAMKKTTDELDRLMEEASKDNNAAALEAYQTAFALLREGILRVENQGHSKFHVEIEKALEEILKRGRSKYITMHANKMMRLCKDAFDETCIKLATEIIEMLKEKGVSKETLNDNYVDIYEAACYQVKEVYNAKGIDV